MLDVAIAPQPGTNRRDVFVLNTDHSVTHVEQRSPVIPPAPDPNALGGWIAAGTLKAFWLGDGSLLEVWGIGMDGKVYYRQFDPVAGTWSGPAWNEYGGGWSPG